MEDIENLIESPIEDPDEELYTILTTPRPPPPSLGFINRTSPTIDLTLTANSKIYTITQSPGLLSSSHKDGTTGAVVWRLSVALAEGLLGILLRKELKKGGGELIRPESRVLELGAGISGLLAVSVGVEVRRWVATDVENVMKGLRDNIRENLDGAAWSETEEGLFEWKGGMKKKGGTRKGKKTSAGGVVESSEGDFAGKRIKVARLNWETDDVEYVPALREDGKFMPLDLIISCDCVYNGGLIPPLISVLVIASQLSYKESGHLPKVLVVLEVRAEDVLETWIQEFHRHFNCGQLATGLLGETWLEKGGEAGVAFLGVLREEYLEGIEHSSDNYLVTRQSWILYLPYS